MKSLALKTSALLEIFLIQALLYLVLLPLKLIYRAPQPSWNSWFMNQKLCQLDRQYCWNSHHAQVAIPITQKNLSIWLPQPYKPALTITHLSSLNTSLLKRSPFRFKTSPTGSNGKAGQCHWLSGSCTSLLRTWPIRCPLAAKDTTQFRNDWGSCEAFDWDSLGRNNPEQSHLGASLPNRFFAAVITATLKKKCEINLMSPIFRCLGCGQYIERSLATYKKQMGQIFCSTCNDRKQLDAATGSKKT